MIYATLLHADFSLCVCVCMCICIYKNSKHIKIKTLFAQDFQIKIFMFP